MHEFRPDGPRSHSRKFSEYDERVIAIVSAANRHGAKSICDRLVAELSPHRDFRVAVVSSSQEATAAAREAAAAAGVVVAVGGDGTVADVATGIFGSGAALGIVPAGSTNITARSLGIPTQLTAAIATLAGPRRVRTIDTGRSADRAFLHIAGAGFDAELFRHARPAWKRHVGWLAYLPAAAAAARLQPSLVRVTVDKDQIDVRSSLVLIANGGSAIAPSFQLYPGIAVDDGWLDVLVFTSVNLVQIAATLSYAGRQRLDDSPHVIWRRGRNVLIDASPPLGVELDGDLHGETPRQFQVVPSGINIVVPPD